MTRTDTIDNHCGRSPSFAYIPGTLRKITEVLALSANLQVTAKRWRCQYAVSITCHVTFFYQMESWTWMLKYCCYDEWSSLITSFQWVRTFSGHPSWLIYFCSESLRGRTEHCNAEWLDTCSLKCKGGQIECVKVRVHFEFHFRAEYRIPAACCSASFGSVIW